MMTDEEMEALKKEVQRKLGEALGISFLNDKPQLKTDMTRTEVRKLANKVTKIKRDNDSNS
jgi:hypothetical protein